MCAIRLSYRSRSVSVLASTERASISLIAFWRRQSRLTALKRASLREGMLEMRACTQSISSVSAG